MANVSCVQPLDVAAVVPDSSTMLARRTFPAAVPAGLATERELAWALPVVDARWATAAVTDRSDARSRGREEEGPPHGATAALLEGAQWAPWQVQHWTRPCASSLRSLAGLPSPAVLPSASSGAVRS